MWLPLHVTSCFSLSAFNILTLYVTSDSLIMMRLSVGFFIFIFILVQVLYISWVSISTFLLRCGKVSATVSLNRYSAPFFLYFLGPTIHKAYVILLICKPSRIHPPFFFFAFFLCSSASIVFVSPAFKFTDSIFCLVTPAPEALQ